MILISHLRSSAVMLSLFTILLGAGYPALTTLILQTGFPFAAAGSLILNDKGEVVGSTLIGQNFTGPQYLWGRLSATSPTPYNAAASSGSNYAVGNPALLDAAKARIAALTAANPDTEASIPVDLVTASGSGLDPEISPAAAAYQVDRIAKARGLDDYAVRSIISSATRGRTFGILGEPRVNVVEVNQALDRIVK